MQPAPKKIKLSAPGGVLVEWSDGHTSTYRYDYLRKRCPCASCRDQPPRIISDDDPFKMLGQQAIRPTGADPVGHYAVTFIWNDGHSSGIYSYEFLRQICPCPDCASAASSE